MYINVHQFIHGVLLRHGGQSNFLSFCFTSASALKQTAGRVTLMAFEMTAGISSCKFQYLVLS